LKGKGKGSEKQGGFIKYLVILALGFLVGNLVSKHTGLHEYISQEVRRIPIVQRYTPQPKPEEDGFFSIFNFGGDDEEVVEKRSWWNIF
jgi:hypothetical protein